MPGPQRAASGPHPLTHGRVAVPFREPHPRWMGHPLGVHLRVAALGLLVGEPLEEAEVDFPEGFLHHHLPAPARHQRRRRLQRAQPGTRVDARPFHAGQECGGTLRLRTALRRQAYVQPPIAPPAHLLRRLSVPHQHHPRHALGQPPVHLRSSPSASTLRMTLRTHRQSIAQFPRSNGTRPALRTWATVTASPKRQQQHEHQRLAHLGVGPQRVPGDAANLPHAPRALEQGHARHQRHRRPTAHRAQHAQTQPERQ